MFHTKQIIHLDDHQIVQTTIKKLIVSEIDNLLIEGVSDGMEALKFIRTTFKAGKTVDLIITDLRHPGLNGYDFSKEVRASEKQYGKRIPILLLCIDTEPNLVIKRGLDEQVFDKHLSLSSSPKEIIAFCKSVL